MPDGRLRRALAAAALLVGACVEPPPSFRLVALPEAQDLLRERSASLVEAYDDDAARRPPARPGGLRWRLRAGQPAEPPELGPGPVLLVAETAELAYRAAAALARTGNAEVFVLITASAEERGTLYALDPQAEEIPRGRDS